MDDSKKIRYGIFLAGIAVAAFGIGVCFFAPRFFLWKVHVPNFFVFPEVNRAVETLRQVENPWVRIESASNQVINWRLFFPLVGHYLHLPEILFLSLSHLGCLAVLALVAHIVYRETQDFFLAFVSTSLAATTSWFFVSTGWLTYFDSWLLFGLLVVAFLKSTPLMGTMCFLMPWVDERFILTLPLCLIIRSIIFDEYDVRNFWRNCLVCAIGVVPYLIARITVFFLDDSAQLERYLQINTLPIASVSFPYLFKGIWMGLRGAWVWVLIFGWFAIFQKNSAWAIATIICLFGTFVLNLAIAADISRSMSVLLPAGLAGFLLFYRERAVFTKRLVIGLLIFNLLMPASHVVTTFEAPIGNIYQEIQNWGNFSLKNP